METIATATYTKVQNYYGFELQGSKDLKTDACCTTEAPPARLRKPLGQIHAEVASRYYGCGLVIPDCLEGLSVLDLGCGAGRDVYLLSALVGETGRVVGLDMTPEQLEVARRHVDFHRDQFAHPEANTEFIEGYLETMDEAGVEARGFDLIVSNCVINLSPDKKAVLAQAWRALKPGGEMYFSDVYSDRRVPAELREDETLYGECLSGALYWGDFVNLARQAGFADPRLVEHRPLQIQSDAIQAKVDPIRFQSATYRLFKLDSLEEGCEDYGQAVIYRGTVPDASNVFKLDQSSLFPKGKVVPVCGNTFEMLASTRFAPHFELIGGREHHFGRFEACGQRDPFSGTEPAVSESSCC